MKQPTKVALIGFDCAITALIRKHIEEGICPNFKKVFENGTVAENCLAPFPTITPPNWTCMATGAWPGTNNITDFWRHLPGTSHEGANTHACFNWEHVAAESFWEAAEKEGKRSVILNYPMYYNVHKKLKNSIVLGGAGLSAGVFMDQEFISRIKQIERTPAVTTHVTFSNDVLVSTDVYPGNAIRVEFTEAKDWQNVPDLGDDPLEVSYEMPFPDSLFHTKPSIWHILVRDLGSGYNTVTLSPTKNFNDAYFTICTGEWSHAFEADGRLADNTFKKIHMRAKLMDLDEDDASAFKLYLSHALNKDGEYWIYPQEEAKKINTTDNFATNNTGFYCLNLGWYDYDTWVEICGIHYDWLADSTEALLQSTQWDIFFSHAHPTDHIYHALMTQLDETTCSSPAAHKKAWELHAKLYGHADRYLGRLLALCDEDTLVCLVSDHGATPDGPSIDPMKIFVDKGLTVLHPREDPEWLQNHMENLKAAFAALAQKIDHTKSFVTPERCCHIFINLKGRDPYGIVEPEEYALYQRKICDILLSYVDPQTDKRPFCLALPKEEAKILGLWGEQCGDVVYAVYPEFSAQHGPILPSTHTGVVGEMRPLCAFYGAGVKKGYTMERVCSLVDLVPTFCYMTGWPVPETAEGAVIYQLIEK